MFSALFISLTLLAAQAPATPGPEAEAVINTGAGLLANCTFDATASGQEDDEFHLGLCIGFIKGVVNSWTEQGFGQVCPPDSLDNQQLRDVVVTWLRAHPKARDAPAVGSVLAAVTEAFPCVAQPQVD